MTYHEENPILAGRASRPVSLVLSATITPPSGMPGTLIRESEKRRQQYLEAFECYLEMPDDHIDRIIFLENSDADLGDFQTLAVRMGSRKSLLLINASSDYPASKGKGYGEFRMLDEGLAEVRKVDGDAGTVFWKVTGRLMAKNLCRLIERSPTGYDVYCDLRRVPLIGEQLGGNDWMELRIFSFTLDGYDRYLRNRYDAGYVLEKDFFSVLYEEWRSGGSRIVPRFNIQPELMGVSGYSGKSYSGLEYRSKSLLRSMSRRCLPGLWL
jgi:hypothetical protein